MPPYTVTPTTFDPNQNITIGAIGAASIASGCITVSGLNGTTNWQNTGIAYDSITPNTLQVNGNAEFKGDVKVQGVSLKDTLERINERLAILKPNPELESRWEELRELRQRYQELEADILEKEEIIRILKR